VINSIKQFFYGPLDSNNLFPFLIVGAWSLFWKGLSLWKSSKKSQKYWFIVLLIINTFGILEIIYLAFFQKEKGVKRLVEK